MGLISVLLLVSFFYGLFKGVIREHFLRSNGKSYEGNAADRTLRIGDSVDVEYVKGFPSLNRAVHSKAS